MDTAAKLNTDRGGVLCGIAVLIMLTIEEVVNNCIFVYKMDLCLITTMICTSKNYPDKKEYKDLVLTSSIYRFGFLTEIQQRGTQTSPK